ncbi:MAG: protease inhibitor I42 family protein [Proteobacteria bacterium]|nr:protease inhibitor I42 family protein [Pseudomonadota bacterium]
MRNSTASIALFCLIVLLSGCFAGTSIRLYEIDSGRTVKTDPGDTIEIVLDGNPTTGYQWQVRPWNTGILKQTGEPTYQAKSNAIGSGGEVTFHFEASSTGQTSLNFIYIRSFEKNVPPIKSFNVTVVVL